MTLRAIDGDGYEPARRDPELCKEWPHLHPDLVRALELLAHDEGIKFEALVVNLISLGLTCHGLRRRWG